MESGTLADQWLKEIRYKTMELDNALEVDDYVVIFTLTREIRERLQWLEEGALMYILNIGLLPGMQRFKSVNPELAEKND